MNEYLHIYRSQGSTLLLCNIVHLSDLITINEHNNPFECCDIASIMGRKMVTKRFCYKNLS